MTNSVPVQQAIKFLYLQIGKIEFSNKYCGNQILPENLDLKFTFTTTMLCENKTGNTLGNSFCVKFFLTFSDKEEVIALNIEANAVFESASTVTDEFLTSSFAKLNAPAISFPFLRAFIANFTLNAGYNPIILPAFNFSKAIEEEIKD